MAQYVAIAVLQKKWLGVTAWLLSNTYTYVTML